MKAEQSCVSPAHLLAYCRAGFERECAQELTAIALRHGVSGFVKARPESGFALFQSQQEEMGAELGKQIEFRRLVFPRQLVRVGELLQACPRGIAPNPSSASRAASESASPSSRSRCRIERRQACRPSRGPCGRILRKGPGGAAGVTFDANADERLHVFFVGTAAAHVGVSTLANSAAWPMDRALRMRRARHRAPR